MMGKGPALGFALLLAGLSCLAQAQVAQTGGGRATPTVAGGSPTFDPANKSGFITLSGGNLTATSTAGAGNGTNVRSTTSNSSGSTRTVVFTVGGSGGAGFGLANASFPIGSVGTWLGSTNDGLALYNDGHLYVNGVDQGGFLPAGVGFTTGDAITMEVNLTGHLVEFSKNGGGGGGTFDWSSSLGTGALYVVFEGETSGNAATVDLSGW